jgi:hypothetical protein
MDSEITAKNPTTTIAHTLQITPQYDKAQAVNGRIPNGIQ